LGCHIAKQTALFSHFILVFGASTAAILSPQLGLVEETALISSRKA